MRNVGLNILQKILFTPLFLALELPGAYVGLAITQVINFSGLLQWGIRQSTEASNQLMSVERLLEYKDLLQEKSTEAPQITPPLWPNSGLIKFDNVGLKYAENGPLVLKGLNLEIDSEEKVKPSYLDHELNNNTVFLFRWVLLDVLVLESLR